jgi:hypothetical protein
MNARTNERSEQGFIFAARLKQVLAHHSGLSSGARLAPTGEQQLVPFLWPNKEKGPARGAEAALGG